MIKKKPSEIQIIFHAWCYKNTYTAKWQISWETFLHTLNNCWCDFVISLKTETETLEVDVLSFSSGCGEFTVCEISTHLQLFLWMRLSVPPYIKRFCLALIENQ